MGTEEFIKKAKKAVVDYFNENVEKTDSKTIT